MKVYLDTIGCRLNQSEIERLALQFRAAGHEVVETSAEADLVVVNTCAVTSEASSDSRQKIRQAARSGAGAIAATGCWATLDPTAAAALPGVTWVVPNAEKENLLADVLKIPVEEIDLEPLAREPLPGIHQRTRAFIKVQDGCDNFCTFCVTRLARGRGRSVPLQDVLKDIRRAVAGGAREVVLSGVHLGSWGQDFASPQTLRGLIEAILKDEAGFLRLRLSSLEPWDLDESFFALWQDRRMCRHLHLPLQSGSAGTLRRMARKITPQAYAQLVAQARSAIPDLAVTTDIIAGFPGETESEFQESLDFVRQMDFATGHVFSFSPRPGTAAAAQRQLAPAVRKARNAALREVLTEAAARYRARFIGKTQNVLWETASAFGPQGWQLEGLTDTYLRVSAPCAERRWNQLDAVRLEAVAGDGLRGSLILK